MISNDYATSVEIRPLGSGPVKSFPYLQDTRLPGRSKRLRGFKRHRTLRIQAPSLSNDAPLTGRHGGDVKNWSEAWKYRFHELYKCAPPLFSSSWSAGIKALTFPHCGEFLAIQEGKVVTASLSWKKKGVWSFIITAWHALFCHTHTHTS